MRKVVNSYTLEVPPGIFYIEDILEIYSLLKDSTDKFDFFVDEYVLDDFDELYEFQQSKVKQIGFISNEPEIHVTISNWVTIYISDDTYLSRGIAEKIGTIAKKRMKPFSIKSRTPSILVLIIIMLTFSIGFPLLLTANYNLGYGFMVSGFTFFLAIYFLSMIRRSKIILSSRKEIPSFWKNNRDKIILLVLGAFLGGFVTKLFDIIF